MKYTTIELPDNFEKGDCHTCPFSYLDENNWVFCVFHCRFDECPLEIESSNKFEQLRAEIEAAVLNDVIFPFNCEDDELIIPTLTLDDVFEIIDRYINGGSDYGK